MRSRNCSRPSRGLTLIEVVVGLALLGTVLSTAIVAGSSHLGQLRAAEQKRTGAIVLDQFLSQWSLSRYATSEADEIAEKMNITAIDESAGETWNLSGDRPLERPAVVLRAGRRCELPGAAVVRVDVFVGRGTRPAAWAEIVTGER